MKLSVERRSASLSFDTWLSYFQFGGHTYSAYPNTSMGFKEEEIGADFAGIVQGAYKNNGVVFACILARMLLFSEARFQYRRLSSGRPGDLFGSNALSMLEKPWKNGTTGDLLSRALQDSDLAGNWYGANAASIKRGATGVYRMRPDWVTIVAGSEMDPTDPANALDAEAIGYLYHPGGPAANRDPIPLLPENVAHFAPIPDPEARFRGMSWLTPVVREIMGDNAATTHKLMFFENGATPNIVVTQPDTVNPEKWERWVQKIKDTHGTGIMDAYKTLYLGGGADAKVIGADMKQIDFKVTQGHGETRVAAAAGVPPVIVGLSEGLEASTYSNYSQARRRFADGTMRPLWRNMAGSLSSIVPVPTGAELWYDDRDIAFLREDEDQRATIQQTEAITIRELINSGYKPDSVVTAVTSGDFSKLVHTGLVSVQLQEPGAKPDASTPDATPAVVPTDTPPQDKASSALLRLINP